MQILPLLFGREYQDLDSIVMKKLQSVRRLCEVEDGADVPVSLTPLSLLVAELARAVAVSRVSNQVESAR